jgi:tRNA threonylcarbamoyladenosine modification (KEOPS) complex  Pcc1 subunit
MKALAQIVLFFHHVEHLEIILKALQPEVEKPATPRSSVNLAKEDGSLVLKVETKDTAALRATLNAYLRWVSSLMNVLETLEKRSQNE